MLQFPKFQNRDKFLEKLLMLTIMKFFRLPPSNLSKSKIPKTRSWVVRRCLSRGKFLFTNLPFGKLTAKISFVGYQSVSQLIEVREGVLDLKSISLNPDSKLLHFDPDEFFSSPQLFKIARLEAIHI